MKKNICWGLLILSMILYTDYFTFYLCRFYIPFFGLDTMLFANISLFLMIFLVHNFFYPKNTTDHAQVISYPPMIMLFSANLSVSLSYVLGYRIEALASGAGGLFFMFLSIILISLAIKQFTNIEEDPNPTTSSKNIIAVGIYNWTRNPMYLGLIFFQFGLGLVLKFEIISAFSLLTFIIFNYFVVKREEEYLERKFGDIYLVYKKKIRRWL
jgi:protein-S-isoprenylcysteine O-methyltransferase Ste14